MTHISQAPILVEKFLCFSPHPSCGAVSYFVGLVRNHDHGAKVQKLYYECYPSMADKMIRVLMDEAKERWPVDEIRVQHRVGELAIGEVAVAIAVTSAHREEAMLACRFMIENIKTRVPVWKKQILEDGTGEWVSCHHEQDPRSKTSGMTAMVLV